MKYFVKASTILVITLNTTLFEMKWNETVDQKLPFNMFHVHYHLLLLKVCDEITFLTPQLTSKFLRFWYQQMAHIFLIHNLKFGVPKLGIYEEIIKNVLNNYVSVVTTLNKNKK